MTALYAPALAAFALGCLLWLSELPWFRDRPLVERLRPYAPAAPSTSRRMPPEAGVRQVLTPLAQDLGARLSRLLGVTTDLRTRLQRAGTATEPDAFRLRQLAHGALALLTAAACCVALRPAPAMVLAALIAAPALTILVHEHLLSRAVQDRSERLLAELPVLVEQLGLLISAGHSVTGALARLAERSNGVTSEDLQRVLLQIRHGVPEHSALSEWAESTELDGLRRLTAILTLHGETADLGALIADEARAIRAEAHRGLLETIERRAQLVWIPVTVATLVPGLVFLAVPFMSAMSQVTGGGT